MKWGIIATWEMALEGVTKGFNGLKNGMSCDNAIEEAIKIVEDNPKYKSVGYGGLPNEDCEVELDAAFMNGDTLSIGAVAGIRNFKNPISIARQLSNERFNCFLVGFGAEKYALGKGFEERNMLTKESINIYEEKRRKVIEEEFNPYEGHDTVGMVSLDVEGKMCAGTSTSGLFMKRKGRVGDSPIPGSGFYVDSCIGGAVATGLGEDIMKGCISYEIVRLMGEGHSPSEAAEKAVKDLNDRLLKRQGKVGDISVVCMNNKGEWGAATNIEEFSFVIATNDLPPTVYLVSNKGGEYIERNKIYRY
ncbi:N4-(beta-N-acetylglucosaminyl)-L-asparaginase [Keratinibaculum paraultunense]|uniref:N4-(Beta-N-acetylglucosaminyl)-L-asparaginase n=1 Tax=Keratinibaculum paraultunense TaxID=1278232 RepID=A0A4R3L137_9FIRM|nr:N(4)-(beta-N-acetylglucosaminyl)-L-asparaginase [Keratinibaculum paraultunense]QQY79961.1 N(4)-(beta-N-acetylglucosaminyl)-L-asparaginase [Keratinibaculum paraultunense]TCS91718.1 N4-(beta-N-acetylglucosaminyl)-L-asparaginase [Keratinibaculum paraultunense]